MPGFAWRSHQMTQSHIDLCIQTHERHKHGYGVGKLMLTKAKWATKTYGFYHRNFSPLDVGLVTTIKHAVQKNEHAISASFATSGNGIRCSRAAALW